MFEKKNTEANDRHDRDEDRINFACLSNNVDFIINKSDSNK